jgi:L-threonylcarbamoyladenylate synthase
MTRYPFRHANDVTGAAERLLRSFRSHGVAAIPTETFYGFAVPPGDDEAVAAVFRLKGRPREKALPVVAASIGQIEALVDLPGEWLGILAAAWPAPLTVVAPARSILAVGGSTLAVRIPAHTLLRELLAVVGPVTATSANRAGLPAIADPDQVEATFASGLGVLLDGGPTTGGVASTLVDLSVGTPVLLREGAFSIPATWGVKAV